MKKMLSLFLGAVLLVSAALPAALAADTADAKLTQITQSVKSNLDLDTEAYSSFRGDYEEQELAPVWNLYWEGDTGSLSVTALEDGTIVNYYLNSAETSSDSQDMPTFPQGDPQQAKAAAQAFLNKVLVTDVESVALEESEAFSSLDSDTFHFSGTVLLNGLPSPLSYSLTIRASDNQVTRFWRDVPETTFLGGIPGAEANESRADAAAALKSTLSLRLEYILPDDDSTQAVLCYLPDPVHEFYVDAKTGELVDLTALEEKLLQSMGMGGAGSDSSTSQDAAAEESTNGLSDAEQEGIAQMEGVLSSQKLDSTLRSVSEYGLTGYELVSARFSVGEAEGDEAAPVTCVLRYSRSAGEEVYTRTFTVDARTGEVQRLYSYIPWDDDSKAVLSEAEAQTRAEAFLEARYGERFTHLALYETAGEAAEPADSDMSVDSYSFRFARQENGYFFPDQYYTVRVDSTDGSVCGLSYWYDEETTFASPEGIISADAALDAWMDTYEVTLGYQLVPQKFTGSDPVIQRLEQMGLTAFYYLKLGYGMERKDSYRGIDAKSGQPMGYSWQTDDSGLAYSDISGSWVEDDVTRLAQFNVGYAGGVFQHSKDLTQWDLVCLLYSLNRYPLDPGAATEAERNNAYAAAYQMGILTRAERNDGKVLTRGELVRCLLDAAGYGSVARLEGIFTCAYPDRNTIPESELGYAALAQGLGLISGSYAGSSPATRGQAAAMLCRLMER